MNITNISISNYKSLRSVEFTPSALSVLVGANASGKSNLADCLDFIADVYKHGLERAVERKGGYENIAFRRTRRSKAAIKISLLVELSESELGGFVTINSTIERKFQFHHEFTFVADDPSIRAPFRITGEVLIIHEWQDSDWVITSSLTRHKDQSVTVSEPKIDDIWEPDIKLDALSVDPMDFSELYFLVQHRELVPPTELIVFNATRFVIGLKFLTDIIGHIRIFHISPNASREPGVPTPNAELHRFGGNLPAVIDAMKKNNPADWNLVMDAMRGILPDLVGIEVGYTPSRRLSLRFREEGAGRLWEVEQVSDGTIQTLALLVAIFEPSSTALVLEEPENSVHPWIIRRILDACRQASAKKQIIITTHSPVVINNAPPNDIWVIWRDSGESRLKRLVDLDPEFLPLWEAGSISTFDYLDSAAILEAVPPAPSTVWELEEPHLEAG